LNDASITLTFGSEMWVASQTVETSGSWVAVMDLFSPALDSIVMAGLVPAIHVFSLR
jgi:hypothetical protein